MSDLDMVQNKINVVVNTAETLYKIEHGVDDPVLREGLRSSRDNLDDALRDLKNVRNRLAGDSDE
jgi:hypothetical protein